MKRHHSFLRSLRLVLAPAAVLCLAGANSLAATIPASDDTWVREDNPTSNRNGNDQVNARTDIDADDNDVILLRFPTTDLPSGVSGVSLDLFWYRDSSTVLDLKLYGLNETDPDEATWSETTVTYNDAPGLIPDGSDPTAETGATFDEIQDLDVANLTLLAQQPYGPQVTGEKYSFSSAALDAFLNADTNGQATFLILRGSPDASSNQARFQVKETGRGAELSFVPEPSTLLLAGLAGVGFATRRR